MEKTFTVSFVNPPKPGKKLHNVKTSEGEIIGFDAAKVKFEKGGTYTCVVEESEFQGKTYLRANAILSAREPTPAIVSSSGGGDRFWMPFVSNICAHAIQAGQISDPSQLQLWATAAKRAALHIDKAEDDEPDF